MPVDPGDKRDLSRGPAKELAPLFDTQFPLAPQTDPHAPGRERCVRMRYLLLAYAPPRVPDSGL